MKGKVKWWNSEKGYGFITSEYGEDVFLYHKKIQPEILKYIKEGQQMKFDKEEGPKGPQAINVMLALLQVFLCHSSNDKPAVRDLYHHLKLDSIDPWLDEENLLPGQDWNLEITTAVHSSDAVLVCLSRNTIIKGGYIQKEIKFALDVADRQPEGTIFIIPLKLEECEIPERLRRWQWVNLFEKSGYERLLRSLRHRALTRSTILKD